MARMYVRTYIRMYVCMYVCMHECMYVCMHVCMYACMHACMYVCMYVCMCVCVYVHNVVALKWCAVKSACLPSTTSTALLEGAQYNTQRLLNGSFRPSWNLRLYLAKHTPSGLQSYSYQCLQNRKHVASNYSNPLIQCNIQNTINLSSAFILATVSEHVFNGPLCALTLHSNSNL